VKQLAALLAGLCVAAAGAAQDLAGATAPCREPGLKSEVRCGVVQRPLDPARPDGPKIDVHFVVVPALARRKAAEPLFFIAGGPGQSAIRAAPAVMPQLARLANRRDVVFVDQRGTGRSAPLDCPEPKHALAEMADRALAVQRLLDCRARLEKLPYGDLRFFTTEIAVADLDAVRAAIGAGRIDLLGISYGTRVALEVMRQFPKAVRRAVLDGVAPPDMVLPASFSTDNQAALDALFDACDAEAACRAAYPTLRADWAGLLARAPVKASVADPLSGERESVTLTRDALLGAVRGPLYAPALAAALPAAMGDAARGRFEALVALATGLGPGRALAPAAGMHFSVVCAEDLPRLAAAADRPGAQFGAGFAQFYEQVCSHWPRGAVTEDFYTLAPARAAVLLASGSLDPATPPRHAERVARALGEKARHVVVPNAGHGVTGIGCLRDVVFRFFDAASDAQALALDMSCVAALPRPPAFRRVERTP
jgi:pimeloyl-ACP methyl ester carboxylesterase